MEGKSKGLKRREGERNRGYRKQDLTHHLSVCMYSMCERGKQESS